jgi:DNA-directed RNA polymerase subunit beta'
MATEKFTTAGSILLKHSMPTAAAKENYDLYRPLDKGGTGDLVQMLLKHGGPLAHEHINKLAQQFFDKATEIGASTPLSDYINDSDERHAIIGEFDTKAQQILTNTKNTRNDKQRLLGELVSQYDRRIEKQNINYLVGRGSMAARMAQTGARGNPKQLAVGTSTPLLSSNLKGEIVPMVIKKSFAEGMSPAEHIAMSYMGRGNTVLTQLSTALPGALFKKLSPTVFHEVITIDDCKTKNGIPIPVKDHKSLLGRYTADTNHLIDEAYLKELAMSGVKMVKARSALTCEAPEGICKHCYGLMGNGKVPGIGENVGVIAAQSVSEVLTQAMLSTKHKATIGERKGNAYEQANNILSNPAENFKDEATITNINGKISDIKKTPLGDFNVFVNEASHFVPQSQALVVKLGDSVRKGDALSTGVINPRKLVTLKGLGAGRQYMANELRDIYAGGLDPRHFEIIAKNLMKYVEVINPGHTGFLPGDKVDVNAVAKYLKKGSKDTPVEEAQGRMLATGVHELTAGTILDSNHVEDLIAAGVKTIKTSDSGLRVTPIVPGLQTAKLLDPNWISKLSFSRLKDTLQAGAAVGSEAPMHSTDPITPYIIGNEFGEGEDGQY